MTPQTPTNDPGAPAATGSAPAWLASLLLRRSDILPRFAFHYRRLARQSRPWRRQLRRKLAVTVSGAALLLALAGPVGGPAVEAAADNVITVANAEVRIANNGKCSLSEAIRNANNTTNGRPHADCAAGNPTGPDTINLPANGTFTLTAADNTGDFGPNGLPWIGSAVTINGNGSVIQRNQSVPEFRIMAIGPNGNLALNNVTIRQGYFGERPGYGTDYQGAGILNQGVLTLSGSTVSDNRMQSRHYCRTKGGGIFNAGSLTMTNSAIKGNEAYCYEGSASGGGIYNEGTLTISNSNIAGNTTMAGELAGAVGGGVFNGGTLSIAHSTVSGNLASADYGSGGGIFNSSSGVLDVAYSTIRGNEAEYGGGTGGGIESHGRADIIGTTIVDNNAWGGGNGYAYGYGGGIYNGASGQMTITNSTISANQSNTFGGGVDSMGKLTINNSTITGNEGGGVIAECVNGASEVTLARTIVAGNTANLRYGYGDPLSADEAGIVISDRYECTPRITSAGYNIFGHQGIAGIEGFSVNATDFIPTVSLSAILSPLANNGGPTQTHALPPGSPAIDRAPSAACAADPVSGRDQRGQPRNANGAGGVTDRECDVGAFEFQPVAAAPRLLISPATAGAVGGVAFTPADILQYDPAANAWSLYFKASRVGVTKNLAAFEVLDNGDILMSFIANQPIPGVGTFAPQDVARFHPTALGANTAGSFAWYLDGSTRGLSTSGEKIDALAQTEQGFPALSVVGAASVPRLNGGAQKAQDEDALGYNPDTGGWWLAFDGTAVPGLGVEDVNALWRDPATGDLYVSIIGAFNLSGVKGDGKDIVKLSPNGSGGYTPSLFWDGSVAGFPSTVDGLEIIP